jgi:hypothetical protein
MIFDSGEIRGVLYCSVLLSPEEKAFDQDMVNRMLHRMTERVVAIFEKSWCSRMTNLLPPRVVASNTDK